LSRSRSKPAAELGQVDDLIRPSRPGLDHPTRVEFTRDGSGVTFLAPEPGGNTRSLWRLDLASGTRTLLAAPDPGAPVASHEEELHRQRRRETGSGITDYKRALAADLVVARHAGRCLASRDGLAAIDVPGIENPQAVHPDPAGRRIAWVSAGDLWSADVDGSSARRLSADAEPGVFNGLDDYLAAEELDRFEGAWWSTSGAEILFARVDERQVPLVETASADASSQAKQAEVYRYPFAGGPNPRTTLHIAPVAPNGPTRDVALHLADGYLARVVPHPLGGWLVAALPRDQRSLHWHLVEASGATHELWVEQSQPWINLDDATWVLSDGRVVRATEATGFRHLELRSPDGPQVARLTSGDWVVTDLVHVDEARGEVLFLGTADGVLERHLYTVPLNARKPVGKPKRLTTEPGWHAVTFSDEGNRWVDSWSSRARPPEVVVRSREGQEEVVLHRPSTDAERAGLVVPELTVLPAADGTTELHVALFRPPGTVQPSPGPTVVWIYGGPHSQYVKEAWELTVEPYRQALVRAGFNVVVTDNRGTAHRGLLFESTNAGAFGTVEIDDQVAVLEALAAHGEVDLEQLAISGTSYGGFMTVLAMSRRPDLFPVGVAGAPVVAWRGYDSAYTERYLGPPGDNPEGYQRSSLPGQVSGLSGRLLILHGTVDENVHPRHTAELVDALRAAGRDAVVVMLPDERHLLARRESRRRWLTLALDHLLGAMRPPTAEVGGAAMPGQAAS
jgi:dipeptidyl-peptidase-4